VLSDRKGKVIHLTGTNLLGAVRSAVLYREESE